MIQHLLFLVGAACAMSPGRDPNNEFVDLETNHTQDPCQRLCQEFSASNRGNGFDLCDDPEGSQCVVANPNSEYIEEICTNLYWQRTEEGIAGLVYETDPTLIRSITVTCHEARVILGDVPDQYDENSQGSQLDNENEISEVEPYLGDMENTSNWETAVFIFTHLPFVSDDMSRNNTHNEFLRLIGNFSSQLTTSDFDGSIIAPDITPIVDLFRDDDEIPDPSVVNIVNRFIARAGLGAALRSENETTVHCPHCAAELVGSVMTGQIRFRLLSTTSANDDESAIPLQQLVTDAFNGNCPSCHVGIRDDIGRNTTSLSRIITIELDHPGTHVIIPRFWRFGGDSGPLYWIHAIVHQFPDGHTEAVVVHNDLWYRTNGNVMTLTNLVDATDPTTVLAIFYTRTD